jgi:N-sulfoglucosamine sulfohydrolase
MGPASAFPADAASRKLNFLLITADDLGAESMGWLGCKVPATPTLDAFAGTAHRFVNCHLTAPICQPSREALLTGRVPHRSGGLGFTPIRSDVPTLVEVLESSGYFTACINKLPHMVPPVKFPWDQTAGTQGKNPDAVGADLRDCLGRAARSGKPFFINANITDPHRPFHGSERAGQKKARAPDKSPGKEALPADIVPFRPEEITVPSFLEDLPPVRRELAQYYSSVRRFDVSFGRIISELKQAGLMETTLIVFLSDNGMSFPFSKATVYRHGTWSPVLLRWPGMGPPARSESMVSSVDVMPTVLDILGIQGPAGMDGRSWLPLLRGESQPGRDHVITHVNTVNSGASFAQRCIRTRKASLVFHDWSDGRRQIRIEAMGGLSFNAMAAAGGADARMKARVDQFLLGTPMAFFDLEADPDERRNLIQDGRHKEEIECLARLLLAHMEATGDPETASVKATIERWRAR